MKNLLSQLNPEQREAVEHFEGPLLVLAGAGSGKSRVVTFRIVNLLDMGIPPSQILGVTFTNKAAGEMKERVRNLTNNEVLICTFHSLGARILRESIYALGYKRDFVIYDQDDAEKVLKVCLSDLDFKDKKMEPKAFRDLISRAKNDMISPEEVDCTELRSPIEVAFPKVYAYYQKRLKEYNAVDFDDLLFLTVQLFRNHPEILANYQNRWSFVLIDEYQDTNLSQYNIVRLLTDKSRNLFVVGDPDQSIYSWRGANIQTILNFEKDFAGSKVVRLEQNYRSCTNILEAANALISQNETRYEKNLWSDLGAGEKIKIFAAQTERQEAEFVSERIRYHRDNYAVPFKNMVIFYRTNSQSRAFEDYFLARKIPYQIVGGISFYQRREIKDVLAFLRMIHSGMDYIAFSRTINIPKRGFGDTTIEKIRNGAARKGLTILSYCETLVDEPFPHEELKLSSKQKGGMKNYLEIIGALKEIISSKSGFLKELVIAVIEKTAYLQYLETDPETMEDRKENLDELIAKAAEWELLAETPTLSSFLEELSLKSSLDESDEEKDHVSLMTIHNGKGLEFNIAFLVGMEEDLFPHANARGSFEDLEEERRLCYVGMTRAKEQLYLTYSTYRYMWGSPRNQRMSRFINEIPMEYIEKIRTIIPRIKQKEIQQRDVDEEFIVEMDQTIPDYLSDNIFEKGDAVFHQDFGIGVIKDKYEGSVGLTYKIFFSKEDRERSIVAKYAHLTRI
jgi:DNA helicase II / ATP-dependent DNA helicase PcrA